MRIGRIPRGGDFGAFKPAWGKYQVVVSNYDAPDEPARQNARDPRSSGNGGKFKPNGIKP